MKTRTYYLIVNGYRQPLFNGQTGQMHIYRLKKDAKRKIEETKKFVKLTGRKRFIKRIRLEKIDLD